MPAITKEVITLHVNGKPYKAAKLCKNVAEAADQLYKLNKLRLAAQKEVDKIAADETATRQYLEVELPKNKMAGTTGKVATVLLKNSFVPQVVDKAKALAWCQKNKRPDLINTSINTTGVREIWNDETLSEAKRHIPGIDKFEITKVSCTKKG